MAFKAWMNQELEKWRGEEEGRQIIDLALLATADAGIEGIDKEMIGLIIDYPQESWEIMNIRVELVTQLQKKWEIVLRELQLQGLPSFPSASWMVLRLQRLHPFPVSMPLQTLQSFPEARA